MLNGEMLKALPKVMALTSKLKDVHAVGVTGEEETTQALDKVEEICWNDGARALLLSASCDGEPMLAFIVGGERAAALLASLG